MIYTQKQIRYYVSSIISEVEKKAKREESESPKNDKESVSSRAKEEIMGDADNPEKAGSFLKGKISDAAKDEISSRLITAGGRKALDAIARYAARKAQEEAGRQIVRQAVVRGWQKAGTAATVALGAQTTLAPYLAAISTGGNILLAFQLGYGAGTLINSALIGDKESVHGTVKRQAKEKLDLLWGPQGYDFTDDNEFMQAVKKNNSDSAKKKFNGLTPRDIDPKRIGYIITAINAGFGMRQKGKKLPPAIAEVYKLFDNGYLNSKAWFSRAAAERKAVLKQAMASIVKAQEALQKDKEKGIYRNKLFTGTSEFKDHDKEYVYRVTGENVTPGDAAALTKVEIIYSPRDPKGRKISRKKPFIVTKSKNPAAHEAITALFFEKFGKKFIHSEKQAKAKKSKKSS